MTERLLAALALILGLTACPASAEPWPVKLDDADNDLITDADLETRVLPGTGGLQPVTIRVLKSTVSMSERQLVQSTLGEPRGRGGEPPPAYLHNGVDVRAARFDRLPKIGIVNTVPAKIFTIQDAPPDRPLKYDDHDGNDAKISDYESLLIGDYRYMHIHVEPEKFRKACADYSIRFRPLLLPRGTRLGKAKLTEKFAAHLHLQRELITDRVYTNALPHLARWSDGTPPRFETGSPDPDRPGDPFWNLARVRFVHEFPSVANASPDPFPRVAVGAETLPLLSGPVDILARIKDDSSDPSAPSSGRRSGSASVAPVTIGFEVERERSADTDGRGGVVRPMDVRIDFGEGATEIERGIPFGKDPDREGDRPPEAIASESFFHRIYWVNGDKGTVTLPKGGVKTMDFIVTNRSPTVSPDGLPLLAGDSEHWDTDVPATRNGIYQVHVEARHVRGQAADPLPGRESRKVALCNEPRITSAVDDVTGKSEVAWNRHVRLTGVNFFSPLSLPDRVPPTIRLYHSDTDLFGVDPIPDLEPITARRLDLHGNNDEGQIVFLLPQRPQDVRKKVYASAEIACDPAGPHLRGPLHELAVSEDSTATRIAFVSDGWITTLDGAGRSTKVAQLGENNLRGLTLSGDGQRLAVAVSGLAIDHGELWIYDLDTTPPVRREVLLPFEGLNIHFFHSLDLSGDGSRLVCAAFGEDLEGVQREELRSVSIPKGSGTSSQRVLFASVSGGAGDEIGRCSISSSGQYVGVQIKSVPTDRDQAFRFDTTSGAQMPMTPAGWEVDDVSQVTDSGALAALVGTPDREVFFPALIHPTLDFVRLDEGLAAGPDREATVAGLSYDGRYALLESRGSSHLVFVEADTGRVIRTFAEPGAVETRALLSPDARQVLVIALGSEGTDSQRPADFTLIDTVSGARTELARAIRIQELKHIRGSGFGSRPRLTTPPPPAAIASTTVP